MFRPVAYGCEWKADLMLSLRGTDEPGGQQLTEAQLAGQLDTWVNRTVPPLFSPQRLEGKGKSDASTSRTVVSKIKSSRPSSVKNRATELQTDQYQEQPREPENQEGIEGGRTEGEAEASEVKRQSRSG